MLDLEDAVGAEDKARARDAVAARRPEPHPTTRRVVVRINDAASRWFVADLRALLQSGVTQVMLPKAETPRQMAAVRAACPTRACWR